MHSSGTVGAPPAIRGALQFTMKPPPISSSPLLEASKHEFEFQEMWAELEPIYVGLGRHQPDRAAATEYKSRRAHEIAVKRGKTTLAYLIGILKRL